MKTGLRYIQALDVDMPHFRGVIPPIYKDMLQNSAAC